MDNQRNIFSFILENQKWKISGLETGAAYARPIRRTLMSEYLVEIICTECGNVEYFEIDNLPGGDEHCPYCSECCAPLPAVSPSNTVSTRLGVGVAKNDSVDVAPSGSRQPLD